MPEDASSSAAQQRPPCLFVYGTLRNDSPHPMARTLRNNARWLGLGWLRGRLYDLGEYPGLVVDPHAGELVWGDVWVLPVRCEGLLANLDVYEEAAAEFPPPREYERERRWVHWKDARLLCWCYTFQWPVPSNARRIPHGDWICRQKDRRQG
jgi:gamma-glutamylcyclotransferase (GGCT)/AIG2-like uncharacterized protein YtfP